MKYHILITDPIPSQVLEEYKSSHFMFTMLKQPPSSDDLSEILQNFDAVLIRTATRLTSAILLKNPQLKAIARAGVGTDNIDLKTASDLGIPVFHAPNGNTVSTAEYTVGLILSTARFIPQAHNDLSTHRHWERKKWQGVELYGKTIGIIGYGKIGQAVARICQAFGMRILIYDPFFNNKPLNNIKKTDIKECLRADFITLHVPLNESTRHLIGKKELEQMKPSARLVNASRGEVIDEQALTEHLKHNKIACAALDVFPNEPPLNPDSPLLSLSNCICMPHLGAATAEARMRVAEESLKRMTDYLETGNFELAINAETLKQEKT